MNNIDYMVKSKTPLEIRKQKADALIEEIRTRIGNNDTGEIYITWKNSSVQMKFSHWINPSE